LIRALITGSFTHVFWVVIVILTVNFIDNNIVEPLVLGGSISISPLFTFLTMIAGGLVWGIAGIILFVPLLGIIKIVFEEVEDLHLFAYLISESAHPPPGKILSGIKRIDLRKKKKV
jgi:predicted PurR-regulated permease PerM